MRYLSPEAIQRRRFSEKSDVWAFGVLLWEMASLGQVPYLSLGVFVSNDDDIMAGVCAGSLRLPRPPGCPSCLYQLMTTCWEARPNARPSFQELRFHILEATMSLQGPSQTPPPVNPSFELQVKQVEPNGHCEALFWGLYL